MWSSMPAPWQACFEEAWEAYCSGSIPIGAAIADRHGTVISRGRNRMHEAEAPPDQICGTRLAHAEINALLQIRTADSGELKDLIIYTTTEPCVLCFGAIAMSGIRTVRYAECDLNRSGNAFIRDRNLDVRQAEHRLGEIQRVPRTDYVLRTMDAARAERFLDREGGDYPQAVELGRRWHASGRLAEAARRRVPIAAVVDEIAAELDRMQRAFFTGKGERGMDELRIVKATDGDVERLARMNQELIEDEQHENPMNVEQLAERMRGFLNTTYSAWLFTAGGDVKGTRWSTMRASRCICGTSSSAGIAGVKAGDARRSTCCSGSSGRT
ncbi:MAG: hypothetical protein A9Z00_07925 [Thermobacillus sp. ZCTH02-B1]|uniref:nucleoside deaminase n=1 Tax=Thermobacillus sp. ZCTH02-B1 TaxID=1858795 RepID=UPI000B54EA48|nr:nucleoside deaminase [Thermobacillus sp. ZCTH02-B1]OUM95289.1 MAG: hypothetical protein A9Z00_07925 [Thermobacillus sp. ZCTH02-B1]